MANLVAGSLLSLRIVPGNKSRFEIHPNLIKTLDTKGAVAFLTAWSEGWGARQRGRALYCKSRLAEGCTPCCSGQEVPFVVPGDGEAFLINVKMCQSSWGEAGKVAEVDFGLLGHHYSHCVTVSRFAHVALRFFHFSIFFFIFVLMQWLLARLPFTKVLLCSLRSHILRISMNLCRPEALPFLLFPF